MKRYNVVLSIAGSDPCAGAGIQADIKTISANGAYALTVITALTAQNTQGVEAVLPIPVRFIQQQLDSITEDIVIDAIKVGMLSNPETVDVVSDFLSKHPTIPVVIDPVMYAKNGCELLSSSAKQQLSNRLLFQATLLTPNCHEAEQLSQQPVYDKPSQIAAAESLANRYQTNVLVKGGHARNQSAMDILYRYAERRIECFNTNWVQSCNVHGTGCALASGITSCIAQGMTLSESIRRAKDYLYQAIVEGRDYKLGNGHGPVKFFW